ncbi:MAG TPA: hypothetical protein VFM55_12210 [Micromonosporaceae bacterium]|nr:hypothetical protein [Micromonosporaceae bacterium]
MELIPAEYRCADDGQDLTALVREELEEWVPASFGRRDTFRVVVTCPGGEKPHEVGVSGRYVGPRR